MVNPENVVQCVPESGCTCISKSREINMFVSVCVCLCFVFVVLIVSQNLFVPVSLPSCQCMRVYMCLSECLHV